MLNPQCEDQPYDRPHRPTCANAPLGITGLASSTGTRNNPSENHLLLQPIKGTCRSNAHLPRLPHLPDISALTSMDVVRPADLIPITFIGRHSTMRGKHPKTEGKHLDHTRIVCTSTWSPGYGPKECKRHPGRQKSIFYGRGPRHLQTGHSSSTNATRTQSTLCPSTHGEKDGVACLK
jgi:hypothetical protein